MGAEESKPGSPCFGLMGPSTVVSNMNRQAQMARAWSLLHQCSLEQWRLGHGEAAGFGETEMCCNSIVFKDCSPAFCTSRQKIINIPKSSRIFRFRRRRKFTKMAEHFEYRCVPAQMSCIQNFQVKSVICVQGNTVILHLFGNMMTQFGVVDLSQDKLKGIFGEQLGSIGNEELRGKISPDGSMVIIKLPYQTTGMYPNFVLLLHDLRSLQLLQKFDCPSDSTEFAFDPRFSHSRFAATNFHSNHASNSLSLVRTRNCEIVATNPRLDDSRPSQNLEVKDLMYSKDGSLIFAFLITAGCHCRERRARRTNPSDVSIFVFNSDTATTVHCIQYYRYTCGLHMCPINYMPVFSHCGNRMAILLNDMENTLDNVQIYKLPSPMSLQQRCRVRILQRFGPDNLDQLPLPNRLIQFLKFKPDYE